MKKGQREMVTFEQAFELILRAVTPLEQEAVDTIDSLNRVASQAVVAPRDLPIFDNSAMDGYALRAEDCVKGVPLDVIGFVPAGTEAGPRVRAGCAVRVMTGAAVPEDADAVVPIEEAECDASGTIRITGKVQRGRHIRCAGEDVQEGETVISAGTPIGVAEVNLLAAMGISSLPVHRKPVVAILATGDELVELGGRLTSGKIFDSNSLALAAAVKNAGATPMMLGIARDDRENLRKKIEEGLKADALITAAGVSVGDCDLVREVLAKLGANEIFWGVEMKPGKATAFAIRSGKPVFSVPGNPVSAMITFEALVRPALLKMGGRRAVAPVLATATLQDSLRKKPGRVFFARVALKLVDGRLLAWSAGPQDTGFQRTMSRANGIAVLSAESTEFSAGDEIQVQILSSAFNLLETDEAKDTVSMALRTPSVLWRDAYQQDQPRADSDVPG